MDENDTSKDLAAEGKKNERGRSQPVRIHELLGIAKSTGKSKNGNASMMQSQRSQPVLVKDLFKSTSSCKKPYPSGINSPNLSRSSGLHGDAGSQAGSRSVQLGVSKSEGKHVMNGPGFRQPERVKNLMESWEKSQTVKRQARKSVTGDLRVSSVRRKLYNAPSPAAAKIAPSRHQNRRNSTALQRKNLKSDQQKSSQNEPRRSCLLPPNSIRDKHINRQQNDTIREESPASLLNESEEKKSEESKKSLPRNQRISLKKKIPIESTEKSVSDDEKFDEAAPQRPTVIMAATSNGEVSPEKNSAVSPRSSEDKKSPFALSRPPFRELDRESFPKLRLDAAISSIEDLLLNSRPADGEPSIGNLPCNSFLEQPATGKNSQVDLDEQTVRWMRGNLKLAIQSTEENLFAMKKILRALDDLVDDESSVSEAPTAPRNDEEIRGAATIEGETAKKIELPAIVVEDSEKIGEALGEAGSEPDEEENKENVFLGDAEAKVEKRARRRSARLAALELARSPKNSDDSFSAIERELNIVHEKSKAATPRIASPRERRKIDPRSRRSMREYMALKSMVNCLQTPDVKGARTPKGETKDLTNQIRAKRSISRTLMNELDDLYADSPQ